MAVVTKVKMLVREGELFMIKDGKPAKAHIQKWQDGLNVADGTPVRLVSEEVWRSLMEDVVIARSWGA